MNLFASRRWVFVCLVLTSVSGVSYARGGRSWVPRPVYRYQPAPAVRYYPQYRQSTPQSNHQAPTARVQVQRSTRPQVEAVAAKSPQMKFGELLEDHFVVGPRANIFPDSEDPKKLSFVCYSREGAVERLVIDKKEEGELASKLTTVSSTTDRGLKRKAGGIFSDYYDFEDFKTNEFIHLSTFRRVSDARIILDMTRGPAYGRPRMEFYCEAELPQPSTN